MPHTFTKEGVQYVFADMPNKTSEEWLGKHFPSWEPETFAAFKRVQDREKTCIDIGAWIGTTAVWLSSHFKRVVCVEADPDSVVTLKETLRLSECNNVDVCDRVMHNSLTKVRFGGFTNDLNTSMSHIKMDADQSFATDSLVDTITLSALCSTFSVSADDIGFIKCDIEGGEELVLEDILSLAAHRRFPVYISFHVPWWRNRDVGRFAHAIVNWPGKILENDIQIKDPIRLLQAEGGFTSLLFCF